MTNAKDGAKVRPVSDEQLSDKELDGMSGSQKASHEAELLAAKELAADELAKVSGGTTPDPRRGIPGEIFGPPKK